MSRDVYSEEVGKKKEHGWGQWKAYGQTLWMMRRENEVVARVDRTPSTRPCHQMMDPVFPNFDREARRKLYQYHAGISTKITQRLHFKSTQYVLPSSSTPTPAEVLIKVEPE